MMFGASSLPGESSAAAKVVAGDRLGGPSDEVAAPLLQSSAESSPQAERLNPKLKKKAYMYEYHSPNPDIREKLKKQLIHAAVLQTPSVPNRDIALEKVDSVEMKSDIDDRSQTSEGNLNPTLTKRAYVYEYIPPRPDLRDSLLRKLVEGNDSVSEKDKLVESQIDGHSALPSHEGSRQLQVMDAATKKLMLHSGKWLPPVYNLGKLQKDSGMWMCCSSREQFSLYCSSIKHREDFQHLLRQNKIEADRAAKYSKLVEESRRGPWERQEIKAVEQKEEDVEKAMMNEANSEESTLNGPMLISWTHKNMSDPLTAAKGLQFLLRTMQTGEGCAQFHRHEGCDTLLKAYNFHPKNAEILLLCVTIWRQLLDCNCTRDLLINDTVILQAVFSIANRYMRSADHVTMCLRCMMQCARSEICRLYILDHNLLGSALRSFNWVATTEERLVQLFELGCIKTTIKCMERHISNPDVLAPALLFMTRVAAIHLPAADFIVRKKAIPTIINALRALYSHELLQVEGLKMLRALSKSKEGWDQISKMKGGWQAICQGTAVGDALIHELPGSFHNPGWCIGETPYLPLLERRKLAVAALSAAANMASRIRPKGAWTPHSLRQFMGLTMKVTRLNINNEEHDVYFEVITTLDLLPHPKEDKEEWFGRINGYETENGIKISDMVDAIISMRLKKKLDEKIALKESLIEDDEKEYIKPIYVAGKLFNQKEIEESDKNLQDHLAGVVSEQELNTIL